MRSANRSYPYLPVLHFVRFTHGEDLLGIRQHLRRQETVVLQTCSQRSKERRTRSCRPCRRSRNTTPPKVADSWTSDMLLAHDARLTINAFWLLADAAPTTMSNLCSCVADHCSEPERVVDTQARYSVDGLGRPSATLRIFH